MFTLPILKHIYDEEKMLLAAIKTGDLHTVEQMSKGVTHDPFAMKHVHSLSAKYGLDMFKYITGVCESLNVESISWGTSLTVAIMSRDIEVIKYALQKSVEYQERLRESGDVYDTMEFYPAYALALAINDKTILDMFDTHAVIIRGPRELWVQSRYIQGFKKAKTARLLLLCGCGKYYVM